MADSQSTYRRLAGVLLVVFIVVAFHAPCFAQKRYKHKRHFLSWESVNANDRLRPWRKYSRPEREFNVTRRKVIRLKKPSFFDKRPTQFATPVESDGRIYVGNTTGLFYCIDMSRSEKCWTVRTEGGVESPAIVQGTNVYVGDTKGYAYSFDADSGEVAWKTALGNEILGAPLAVGDVIYFVTLSGRLFALERMTGMELWHTDAMEKQVGFSVRRQSSPVYHNGTVIFGTSRGTLMSYFEDGTIAWVRLLGDPSAQVMDVDSRPLIIADRLYAATADGTLFCLDPEDGEIIWSVAAGGVNDLLYHDGLLYVTGRGVLTALDPDTGTTLWDQNPDVHSLSSPAAGNGFIAVVDTEAKLYLIDDKRGDIVYERYIRRGSYGDPIVVGEELYVLANTSRVFSFIIREKEKVQKDKEFIKGEGDEVSSEQRTIEDD